MLNPIRASLRAAAILTAAMFIAAGAASADVCQGNFQGKTFRFIVSGSPGSAYDVAARLLGPHFASLLGAKVTFESLRGGSGLVAMNEITAGGSDGTTLGMVGGAQTLSGFFDGRLPDPARGLAILGQVEGSLYVWAVGKDSEIRSMEDVFRIAEERPLLFAIYEPTSGSFTRIVAETSLLGVPVQFVSGYRGGAQIAMAGVRNEVDIVAFGVEGRENLFANGDLIPLLQATRIGKAGPLFAGLPTLFGPGGLVERRTRELGRDPANAALDAKGLEAYLGLGRMIVAPKETRPDLVRCMRAAVDQAYALPALRADFEAADRVLAPQTAAEAIRSVETARELLPRFKPAVEAARADLRR